MSRLHARTTAFASTFSAAGLPRAYWGLWLGMLVNRLGGGVFPFLAVYLTRERGFRAEQAGLAVALYGAGGMLAGPLGGSLADRIGRRATLLAGTTLGGTTMLLLAGARAPRTILLLAPLLGLFTDLCRPALQAAVADLIPPADRARAFGLLYWAINLGFAGAAACAGALAERSFLLLFLVDAFTTFAFGAFVFFGVPESRPPGSDPPTGRGVVGLLGPFADGRFLPFLLVQTLVLVVLQQAAVPLSLDLQAHGITPATIGALLALNGVTVILVQPFATRLLGGMPVVRTLALGAALVGVGFGLTALAETPTPFAATIVIWTLGEITFVTATPVFISDVAPSSQRGRYQGAHQLIWGLAGVLAPPLGATALAAVGRTGLWGGCAATGLLAALLHLRVTARANRKR